MLQDALAKVIEFDDCASNENQDMTQTQIKAKTTARLAADRYVDSPVGRLYCDTLPDAAPLVMKLKNTPDGRSPLSTIARSGDKNTLTPRSGSSKKAHLDPMSYYFRQRDIFANVEEAFRDKENVSGSSTHSRRMKKSAHVEELIRKDPVVTQPLANTMTTVDTEPLNLTTAIKLALCRTCDKESQVTVFKDTSKPDEDKENMPDIDEDKENMPDIDAMLSFTSVELETNDSFRQDSLAESFVQLDKKARCLRRRSQQTNDTSECERILHHLELIRKKQRQLLQLQNTLQSRLLKQIPTASLQPLNVNISQDEPLNLKVTSACDQQNTASDVISEPAQMINADYFKLNVPIILPTTSRTILGDITDKVVSEMCLDGDLFIEVPDSPESTDQQDDDCFQVGDDEVLAASSDLAVDSPAVTTAADKSISDGVVNRTSHKLEEYLANLDVSDISVASPQAASPDTSSEFTDYRSYKFLKDGTPVNRCINPVANTLHLGDEQVSIHFI